MSVISMGDALQEFLQKSRLKYGVQSAQIETIWAEIMGKTVSKYTDKVQIFKNTLFITTSVAPLKQELHYQKEQIIKRVNEALGEKVITEVVIR